jgi:hypothetical protein
MATPSQVDSSSFLQQNFRRVLQYGIAIMALFCLLS